MTTDLERLEAASGRAYKHTRHDAELAREKAATAPATLTDMDLAVLGFFGGAEEAERARAARTAATAPPAKSFEDDLADVIATCIRWALKKPNAKIAALEAKLAMLEARTSKDGDA